MYRKLQLLPKKGEKGQNVLRHSLRLQYGEFHLEISMGIESGPAGGRLETGSVGGSSSPKLTDLTGRVALVTGGSRGIGRAVAVRLAQGGAKVAITYRENSEAAHDAADAVIATGGAGSHHVMTIRGDVSASTDVDQVVKAVLDEYGRIDILVNNAGITLNQLLARTTPEQMLAIWRTNELGTMLMSKAVLRGMMRQRYGRVVNITSVVGLMGNGGQSTYAASKAAVIAFTKSVAREVASRGITANCIAPGVFFTDIWEGVSQEHRDLAVNAVPLGAAGKLEDVAEAVAFLASDAARYITGQTLNVDGGMVMS